MTDLSIVVCTYDRPASLDATLRSCLAQTNALGLAIEIVVIDNHPSGSGRPVVEALAGGASWPVRYVTELTRNMSTLRNRGFAEASGRLVAFIDDDEVAEPVWLDQLVGALRATDADIAVGPRLAVFAGEAPSYDPTGSQFVRDLGLPDLALIPLTAPSGKPRYGLGTGNSLFDVSRCFPNGEPAMREAFGDAGGEDAELFVRLYGQGRRIAWAAQAVVTETVAPHRTAVTYRLIRVRREAQHYVSIYLDATPNPRLTWAKLMAKGLAQTIVGFVFSVMTFEFGSRRRLAGRSLMEHGLGKLLWKRAVGYIAEPSPNGET
ncbi:glycosyltransferase family 2 protein [Caulobacter sp.]|uniref:glycosyltransferase family 2 protein n=1 Tax=Caulobacter sp. TaxID=78 RepID=UPI002B46AC58|nr:glycosyltransferase family 2 protein [Caulobacter sp.]HJV41813.1 glycosyltransferase family 2 protein [Caulobacter sp.]